MSTYEEVLSSVQRLSVWDQARLLNTLSQTIPQSTEVEGTSELISAAEIAESEAAFQAYRAGQDTGISADELKLRIFGGSIG